MNAPEDQTHYCQYCRTDFFIRPPLCYTGDAIIKCPNCGKDHHRQFEAGIAVSCEVVTSRPIYISAYDPESIR